ncbi:hypothetical protein NC651_010847 [Populus alba x Populus x berolinensis]|nr:hypothetical protein NC651_010847 [Populus alba x Populus x berolinensis]
MRPLGTAAATSFLSTLLLFLHLTASSPSNYKTNLANCNQNFSCGDLTEITYPFTGGQRPPHCGPPEFRLTCFDNSLTTLTANSLPYRVTRVNQTSQTLRLSRSDFYDDLPCTHLSSSTTFDNVTFSLVYHNENLTLFYGCKDLGDSVDKKFKLLCGMPGGSEEGFFKVGDHPPMERCHTSFQVPFLRSRAQQLQAEGSSLLGEVLKEGFDVRYSDPYSADCQKCSKHSGRQCGFDVFPFNPLYVKMRPHLLLAMSWFILFITIIFVCGFTLVFSADDERVEINCSNQVPEITITQSTYKVLAINNQSRTLNVARTDYRENLCPTLLLNTTLNPILLNYTTDDHNITIYYGCPAQGPPTSYLLTQFPCSINTTEMTGYFTATDDLSFLVLEFNCLELLTNDTLCETCNSSGGQCGYDQTTKAFACYCADQPRDFNWLPSPPSQSTKETSNPDSLKIGLSKAGTVVGVFLGCWIMTIIQRKRRKAALLKSKDLPIAATPSSKGLATSTNLSQTTPSLTPSKSDIDKGSTYFGVRVFSYNELEEATNCFHSSKELGDGGFGTVYYGVLRDGRVDFGVRKMVTSVAELAFRCLQHEREMRPTMEEVLEILRRIEKENYGAEKADVLDIREDDVGLMKHPPPPLQLSPDSTIHPEQPPPSPPSNSSTNAPPQHRCCHLLPFHPLIVPPLNGIISFE